MGHIVRRATPAAPPREPLPTTKISELRLDGLVRETLPSADEALARDAPLETSTIAMPRLSRPDAEAGDAANGQVVVLRSHENSAPTRQIAVEPDPDLAPAAEPPALPRPAIYPVAPVGTGAQMPQVLLAVLVLTIGWLAASLIYAIR